MKMSADSGRHVRVRDAEAARELATGEGYGGSSFGDRGTFHSL